MIKNLKLLRQNYKISQQQLADVIGVSQQSINKYENHNIEPDIETLMKMADYFCVSVDYLIGHSDEHGADVSSISADEAKLINNFRSLTPKQRESIVLIIKNYLGTKY